ncbi:TonB-dependent receptor, partial [Bacillus pumilus]
VDYPAGAGPQDRRHQYSTTPTEDYALGVNVDYSRFFSRDSDKLNTMFVRPFYRFNQSYQASDYSLYRLDRLADYTDETYSLGMLPSTQEALLSVRDAGN